MVEIKDRVGAQEETRLAQGEFEAGPRLGLRPTSACGGQDFLSKRVCYKPKPTAGVVPTDP